MKRIRWRWVLGGGLIAEIVVWVIVLSGVLLVNGRIVIPSEPPPWQDIWYLLPAGFFGPLVITIWLGRRKITSRLILHGFLIGLVCVILGPPNRPFYIVVEIFKLTGGVLGGIIASRRLRPELAGTPGTTGAA